VKFNIDTHNWGGSGIGRTVFEFICDLIPAGSTMVELGGGACSTIAFASRYNLYTIEESPQFIAPNINTTWIYAPKKGDWYNRGSINKLIPKKYNLLFIDGPSGAGNRNGVLNNMDLIPPDCEIVLHDTCREEERWLAIELAKTLSKTPLFYDNGLKPTESMNDSWCHLSKKNISQTVDIQQQ
jgi:hypothetical protein|tara:strand:- start:1515 stop:2063 length:549 start_codon:yes stop_codon:yes gene_type:complete